MPDIEGHTCRQMAVERSGQSEAVIDLGGFLTIDDIGLVAQGHSFVEGIEIFRLRYSTQGFLG